MNVEQMKTAIRICIKADIPLMIWGPGGIGKSEGIEQVAIEDKIGYYCFEAPVRDPIDICGYPAEDGKYMVWKRPCILPEEGRGIFHIDELPDATNVLMKALYHLILKGEVAGHVLGEGWYRIGSGNRPEDGGHSSLMPAPLITRFCHLGVYCESPDFSSQTPKEAEVDFDAYELWAISHLNPMIITFLKFKPIFLYHHQAVPRTWEYISKLIKSIPKADLEKSSSNRYIIGEIVRGTVGRGPGTEFMAFMELATKLPSIDAIIKAPSTSPVPKKGEILYAVTTSLMQRLNDKTCTNIVEYMKRLPEEYQFFFFRSAITIYKKLISNENYVKWVNENLEELK